MAEERVQKILARAGYGSRRASEELITAGRVKINGKVAVLGSKADPQHDTITIDNQPVAKEAAPVYIAVNKPQGILSEVSQEEPRQTVRDLVPVPGHLFIVGRLDMESEGLILLTNDGELANRLTHPRYGHEKEYRVLVGTRPDSRQLEAWKYGVVLEDGYRTAPAQARVDSIAGKGAWLQVILREGRKRQIREMGRQTGVPVLRIIRIRIGSLLLGDLKPGAWRELRGDEVRALKVNKPYRESTGRPVRKAPGRTAGRAPGKTTGSPAGKPADTRADKPTGKPAGKPASKPAGRTPRGPRQEENSSRRKEQGGERRNEERREGPKGGSREGSRPPSRKPRSDTPHPSRGAPPKRTNRDRSK